MSNVKSVINMLNKIGFLAVAQQKPTELTSNAFIVLPGVGTFDQGVKELASSGWGNALKDAFATEKSIILGLCLGMQLLSEGSEEGDKAGLGIIPGHFKKFEIEENQTNMKVPHMGWNEVDFNDSILDFSPIKPIEQRYYFVHSYHYSHQNDDQVVGMSYHGSRFASAIKNKKALGLQFHPEKSHRFGAQLFSNLLTGTNA